jgi:hypothetical protein
MARVIPDQPAAFQASVAAIPLDWVRASSVCIAYRHNAGVPQHRWGVFLNDFDQFIQGRGGWAERAATKPHQRASYCAVARGAKPSSRLASLAAGPQPPRVGPPARDGPAPSRISLGRALVVQDRLQGKVAQGRRWSGAKLIATGPGGRSRGARHDAECLIWAVAAGKRAGERRNLSRRRPDCATVLPCGPVRCAL